MEHVKRKWHTIGLPANLFTRVEKVIMKTSSMSISERIWTVRTRDARFKKPDSRQAGLSIPMCAHVYSPNYVRWATEEKVKDDEKRIEAFDEAEKEIKERLVDSL